MKIFFPKLVIFLVLYSITITKGDICGQDQISVSALGKCQPITDLLLQENLTLKTENLLYLASNNEGKIQKNGYKLEIYKLNDPKLQSHNMRKSKLYIPNSCLKKMEAKIDLRLDKSKGIVIIVYDSNNLNDNNITDNYFIIRHNSENARVKYINSKTNDLSFCHEDPILFDDEIKVEYLKYANDDNSDIDIDKILYGRKKGIDLFDRYSRFLNDTCFKFKSEKGSDVPLESRLEDYYQNISFCDDRESSHYISYNYSETKNTFTYRCAFGYYSSEDNKASYLDIIDAQIKSLVSVSNIKVITCYKQFLNIRDIIRNYGGMICILVLIIQIVCLLIFCFYGIKPLEDKLDDLFIAGKVILRSMGVRVSIFGINDENDENQNVMKIPKKKFNLWGQIKKLRQMRLLREKEEEKKKNKKKKKGNNPPKKDKKRRVSLSNPRKETEKENPNEIQEIQLKVSDINEDDNINIINNEKILVKQNVKPLIEKTPQDKEQDQEKKTYNSDRNNQDSKISMEGIKLYPIPNGLNSTPEEKEKDKKKNEDKNSEQIYDYENDELNELPLDKALKLDKRPFCVYYGNILLYSHIITNVFFRFNDYNLFVIKFGLFFMTFPINLTMNIFFFTNKSMKLNYIKSLDDISTFWSNIDNTVYSSILANTLLIILKLLCLTHNSVRKLRKINDVNLAQTKSVSILRCTKARIIIYYILSLFFLIIFGFYVLCFCAVFENTQIELVKSTFTSWLMSLFYPFIICLITSIIRKLSFSCNSKCLYFVKRIMEYL